MAWTLGNLRWSGAFRSLAGRRCSVRIYQRGYTGTDVTHLTLSDDPISWEETTGDSILTTVRTKTGYLRVVEEARGDLDSLRPSTDRDHYIEVTYGSALIFSGFLQSQNFKTRWEAGPRELEFPIQSPLAVSEGVRLPLPSVPAPRTLGNVLAEVCSLLQAEISTVVFPTQLPGPVTGLNYLAWYVPAFVLSPVNTDKNHTNDEPAFTARTCEWFLDALCSAFDLTVHDLPGKIVFTRFDYTGEYTSYDLAALSSLTTGSTEGTGADTVDLSAVSVVSDRGSEALIQPVSRVAVSYDGDFKKSIPLDFAHSRVLNYGHGATCHWATFTPAAWELSLPYDTEPGCRMMAAGTDSLSEGMVIRGSLTSGFTDDTPAFIWTVPDPPRDASWRFSFTAGSDLDLNEAFKARHQNSVFRIRVRNGNHYFRVTERSRPGDYYWYTVSEWVESVTTPVEVACDGDGGYSLDITAIPEPAEPVIITVMMSGMGTLAGHYTVLRDICLTYGEDVLADYVYPKPSGRHTVTADNGSPDEASVSMPFHTGAPTTAALFRGWTTDACITYVTSGYTALFSARHRLDVDLDATNALTLGRRLYPSVITFDGRRWRVMGQGYSPAIDRVSLSLQHSPILDS